jgi:MFS family permease
VDFEQSRTILLWAILFATPCFVIFGWLSDKYGRKWIMLGGMLLGILFLQKHLSGVFAYNQYGC